MKYTSQKTYFDQNHQKIDIVFVPLKFSLTSKKIRHQFIKLLPQNKSIADLGCGSGGNALIFHQINSKIFYTGIDISTEAINKAKTNNQNPNVHFQIADLNKTKLPKNHFSLIFCSQLLEHLKNSRQFLINTFKSLQPNGYLVLSTVYKKNNAKYIYKNINGKYALAPDHINEYSNTSSLLNQLKQCGFKIIDYDLSLFRYPIIDTFLKFLMAHFQNKLVFKLVNSPLIMFFRYYLSIPIFGFYNFQIIAKKE